MKPSTFFSKLVRGEALLSAEKDKGEAFTGYSKTSLDRTAIAQADRTYFQKYQGKKELEILYRNSWPCFKAINVRANLLSSRGLKIVCKTDKQKKVTKKFLKRLHPSRPMLALQETFRARSICADIWGNAFDELLYMPKGTKKNPRPVSKADKLLGFTPLHPINTDFQRKQGSEEIDIENGVPKGYVWRKNASQEYSGVKLELDRVAHLKYNPVGDELLGMSTLEPIYKTAERLMKIEEGVTQGIITHGNPLHDVIVGDESHPPTKKMIDNTVEEVAGLNSKSEYVHPPWIRVGQIESFSLGKSPNYMQPYITAVAAATGVPEFILLGRGEGTNKATAQAMINFVHQTIEPLQQAQALYFEEQILAPLMELNGVEEVPKIEWNEVVPRDPNDYSGIIKVLSKIERNGQPVVSAEELREMAGLTTETDFKSGVELSRKKKPGIYLTKPHGKLIYNSKKSLIIKSRDFSSMTLKPLVLVSGSKAYGIIKLRKPEKINLQQFKSLRKKHQISEQNRIKWWPDKKKLYKYRFNILKKFDKPISIDVPKGTQTFIKEVKL